MISVTGDILRHDFNNRGVQLHPIWHDVIAPYGYGTWPDAALERGASRALGSR
jgi:hypothetical protein